MLLIRYHKNGWNANRKEQITWDRYRACTQGRGGASMCSKKKTLYNNIACNNKPTILSLKNDNFVCAHGTDDTWTYEVCIISFRIFACFFFFPSIFSTFGALSHLRLLIIIYVRIICRFSHASCANFTRMGCMCGLRSHGVVSFALPQWSVKWANDVDVDDHDEDDDNNNGEWQWKYK